MTKNEDLKALLPCPFCGVKPTLSRGNNGSEEGSFDVAIDCENPQCVISCGYVDLDVHSDSEAIKVWNTRPTVTPTDRRKNKRCEGRNACGGCYPAVCLETDGYERAREVVHKSPTDGDAERYFNLMIEAFFTNPHLLSVWEKEIKTIRTALQSTRKPSVAMHCQLDKKCFVHCGADCDCMPIDVLLPPVDTINIKREVLDGVREALLGAQGIFENCTVSDGMCCCGEDMQRHSNPMDCGHSPLDHGQYTADAVYKELLKSIASLNDVYKYLNKALASLGAVLEGE